MGRVQDDEGRFAETNIINPQQSSTQTITDESGRKITRRLNTDNSEDWEVLGVSDRNGQRILRNWHLQFDGEHRITSVTDPEGYATTYQYDPTAATQCLGCPGLKRSIGWNSLTEAKKFLQIRYPTGGIIRYEWFGEERETGVSNAGGNTFVIVTEFPDPSNLNFF